MECISVGPIGIGGQRLLERCKSGIVVQIRSSNPRKRKEKKTRELFRESIQFDVETMFSADEARV